ncbi:FMN-binding protein [Demequina sp. NBRC 110054]|uniref:FMN-binding protein n=1 Tax=Demequina sp. NBRC 110054 TaxID=1570343 RepID=UPI000A00DEE7|nr:FMN-binding protein [Demequina sp. NBRC 110054]
MNTSRAFMVGGAAAAVLTAGWALTPKDSSTAYASTDTSTTTDSTDTSSSDSDGTYTGESVQTRYGSFSVAITVEGGEVVDVTMVESGETDHESQQINSTALPQLIQEVLETQSADVTYISGASYTSDGFAQSVADAFDQAGL